MRIVEETAADLAEYESVSMRFLIESKVNLDELVRSEGAVIVEIPEEPRWKDYDECKEDRPTVLCTRFEVSNWGVLAAYEDGVRVGGAVIAIRSPGFDMLQGRNDLAVIVDFRIGKELRGKGIGRELFKKCMNWAQQNGCTEVHVETQDTNVAACRFYRAMGCRLVSADPHGYGTEMDEAKLIWGLALVE